MIIKIKWTLLLFPFFFLNLKSFGNNGQRAEALPVSKISIDGNLSDWPTHFTKYSIERSQNRFSPSNKNDFSAHFIIGYDLSTQSIYIGVEVTDDSHVVDSDTYSTHLNQDAHLLYLDLQHSLSGSGVAMYALTKNSLRLVNNHLSWDDFVQNSSINDIEHAQNRVDNKTVYEWEIYLGNMLIPNTTIGLDHVVVDMDKDDKKWEYSTIAWGSNGWKSSMQNNLGDVFIVDPNIKDGIIKGEVGWEDNSITSTPWGIQFISKENPKLWTQLPLRGQSNFNVKLPLGEYQVKVALPSTADSTGQYLKVNKFYDKSIMVKADESSELAEINFKTISAPNFHHRKKGFLTQFDENKIAELDSFLLKVMDYYNIPGMSFGCMKDSKVVYLKSYGTKNYFNKERVTNQTLFDIGSVTKTVFAITVLRLAELGQLDLDKPLYEYLPYQDLSHDSRYKIITARHVLSHQTGLPNWRSGQLDFINEPATEFGYSGEGFEYLKKVIEYITGDGIEKTMRRLVIEPYGIKNAFFTSNPDLLDNLSYGHYDLALQIHAPETETFVAYGMHSNAQYFTPFLIGLLDEQVMEPETYQEMLTKQINIPTDWPEEGSGWLQGYGLGFQLKYSPYGLVFGHGGRNGGFDCNYELYKDLDLGYVFFTNSSSGHLIKNLVREFLITGKKY